LKEKKKQPKRRKKKCTKEAFYVRALPSNCLRMRWNWVILEFCRSVRLTLAHSDIAVAIRQRYMRGSAAENEVHLHRLLAGN
jgi:hypothetical protein